MPTYIQITKQTNKIEPASKQASKRTITQASRQTAGPQQRTPPGSCSASTAGGDARQPDRLSIRCFELPRAVLSQCCMLLCLLACMLGCLLAYLFVCLICIVFAWLFACLLACLFCLFACCIDYFACFWVLYACLFVCLLLCLIDRLLAC